MPAPADKRVLTEVLLRRLRPRAQRFLVWDRKQSGLALQIRPNGRRGWKRIYSCRGRVRWFHLGDGNAIGLQQARELARDIMYALAKGEDPQAEKRAQRSAGTEPGPRSSSSYSRASAPARSAICAPSTSSMAGGKCRASQPQAGRGPRTARTIACGCRNRRKLC
jgi:hypothetical protein